MQLLFLVFLGGLRGEVGALYYEEEVAGAPRDGYSDYCGLNVVVKSLNGLELLELLDEHEHNLNESKYIFKTTGRVVND